VQGFLIHHHDKISSPIRTILNKRYILTLKIRHMRMTVEFEWESFEKLDSETRWFYCLAYSITKFLKASPFIRMMRRIIRYTTLSYRVFWSLRAQFLIVSPLIVTPTPRRLLIPTTDLVTRRFDLGYSIYWFILLPLYSLWISRICWRIWSPSITEILRTQEWPMGPFCQIRFI
jgi:hypothetical protein